MPLAIRRSSARETANPEETGRTVRKIGAGKEAFSVLADRMRPLNYLAMTSRSFRLVFGRFQALQHCFPFFISSGQIKIGSENETLNPDERSSCSPGRLRRRLPRRCRRLPPRRHGVPPPLVAPPPAPPSPLGSSALLHAHWSYSSAAPTQSPGQQPGCKEVDASVLNQGSYGAPGLTLLRGMQASASATSSDSAGSRCALLQLCPDALLRYCCSCDSSDLCFG